MARNHHTGKNQRILILGSTGRIGKAVIADLEQTPDSHQAVYASRNGDQVDVWRREGKDAVYLDLDDARTFPEALRGVDHLFLVGPEESNARNSEPMFLNPLPHLLTRPCPFEWMGVQPIVLRPGLPHVIDELGSTVPRSSLQVVVTECADQQLRFVEPRGVDRGEATSPPAGASRQVVPRLCGRMGRVVIVDQIDSAQVTMPMSECPQLLDVVLGAFRVEARRLHLSAVNDQEEQDVDRAVPRVIELTLRDRAGDRMPDGMSFQDLEVGFLIGTDHPEAPPSQPLGVGVAPEDLLGTLLEVSMRDVRQYRVRCGWRST